jgi:hypothetical protein
VGKEAQVFLCNFETGLFFVKGEGGGWRGSWHCLSGEHLLRILFSWPELRKAACAGRFESCGCHPSCSR